jgi:hypothetical protein
VEAVRLLRARAAPQLLEQAAPLGEALLKPGLASRASLSRAAVLEALRIKEEAAERMLAAQVEQVKGNAEDERVYISFQADS